MVTGYEYDSEFILRRLRLIGLAEEFDEFGICDCSGEMDLSFERVHFEKILVCLERGAEPGGVVEEEVAISDDAVERAVNGFYRGVCWKNFPSPEVSVSVGVTVHRIDEVCLNVGEKGEKTAVEGAALEVGVDADYGLVCLFERGDCLVLRNRILRIQIKAGGRDEDCRKYC